MADIIRFPTEKINHTGGPQSGRVLDAAPLWEAAQNLREVAQMARALEGVVVSEAIPLLEWDDTGGTYVKFQRPSRVEEENLATMQARSELVWSTEERGRVTQRERVPLTVLESEMVAMTLVECNLPEADGETLVFVPGKTCRRMNGPFDDKVRNGFYKAWYRPDFPPELAEEIVDKLIEWHPPFDWRNPGEGEG